MDAAQYIADSVQVAARYIYYGINPEVGSYADEVGKSTLHLRECNPASNLEPWPMYKLVKAAVRTEERGTAYFLTIQVADRTHKPVDRMDRVDRNANRVANSLGVPIGHPSQVYRTLDADGAEFILLRVMRSPDGKHVIEGLIKGNSETTAAKPIEPGTFLGVTQSGNGRDYINGGDYTKADHNLGHPTRPAMSNKELEDRKTILAAAAEGHKPQKLR